MIRPLALLLILAAFIAPIRAQDAHLFDMHVHLHHAEESLAEYEKQAAADQIAIDGAAIMWFGGPNQALAGNPADIRRHNDWVIDAAAKDPRLVPVATVHPYDGAAALAELHRVAARGIKVLKIHPHTQKFDAADPRVLALVRRAGELNVIVLMDNASIVPGDCEKLFNLALAAPKTKFIFAHLGAMNFRFWNIIAAARTAEGLFGENIYFDLSATVAMVAGSPIQDEFVWTIRNVGVDHVLFGSDYPQFSVERNLRALERLGLTAQEQAAIRYGNASKLFGLAPAEPAVVLLVCEHGSVKSLMAASLFNRAAAERHLPFRATARGVAPDKAVPPAIAAALARDGFDVGGFVPEKVSKADADGAARVVAIGLEPAALGVETKRPIESWSDVPAASTNYDAANAALKRHVDALLDGLEKERIARPNP